MVTPAGRGWGEAQSTPSSASMMVDVAVVGSCMTDLVRLATLHALVCVAIQCACVNHKIVLCCCYQLCPSIAEAWGDYPRQQV